MTTRLIIGALIGLGIGALLGHFGKCSSGGCPLTANPFRGAIYGCVMGALFAFSTASGAKKEALPEGEQPVPGEGLIHIGTVEEFNQVVTQAKMPCLVDFYSPSCPPCKRLAPTIDALAEKYRGRAVICKVNVAWVPQLTGSLGIRGVPAVLFFVDGKEVHREVGLNPQATYEQILDPYLKKPAPPQNPQNP